jgi:hypothetical protein
MPGQAAPSAVVQVVDTRRCNRQVRQFLTPGTLRPSFDEGCDEDVCVSVVRGWSAGVLLDRQMKVFEGSTRETKLHRVTLAPW